MELQVDTNTLEAVAQKMQDLLEKQKGDLSGANVTAVRMAASDVVSEYAAFEFNAAGEDFLNRAAQGQRNFTTGINALKDTVKQYKDSDSAGAGSIGSDQQQH